MSARGSVELAELSSPPEATPVSGGLTVLYEAEGLPAYDLPDQLQAAYGGSLGFSEPRLVANFVASVDGVVALPEVPGSTRLISDDSSADRFVLGCCALALTWC